MIKQKSGSSNSGVKLGLIDVPDDSTAQGTQVWNYTPKSDVLQKREIWAWYSYDAATSVYNVVIAMIIPLVLQRLATDYVCNSLTYGCDTNGEPISPNELSQLNFFGIMVKPASYVSYVLSCSVVFQAILFISIGPAADYGRWRKNMLVVAGTVGSLVTLLMAFLCASESNWLLVGLFFMFINGMLGLSIVCYNAFLIILAEHHTTVKKSIENGDGIVEIQKNVGKVADGMSARGFAWGYVAGVLANVVFFTFFITMMGVSSEDSSIIGEANSDEDFQVAQQYNQRVNGFRVWINEDGLVSGLQIKFTKFGWADLIGTNDTVKIFESAESNTDNVEDIRAYSQDGLLTGFSLFRGSWEDFGNTSSSLEEHNFTPSEKLLFGGLVAHLNNGQTTIQGVTFYYYNPDGMYDTRALAACLLYAGLWWLILTWIGIGCNLRSYPGEPLPRRNIIALSVKRIGGTLRKVRDLPQLWKFMLGYFFWGDGLSTINYGATLFMVEEINMGSQEIATCFLLMNITAAVGNIAAHRVQVRYNLTSLQMFWIPLVGLIFFCIYPIFGFDKSLGFGLVSKPEVYIYTSVYGIFVGVIQSYGRVVMSNLIPLNEESEIFSLYEITDKGSSWLGPLIVGVLNQAGNMRYALLYGVWAFGITIPIIWTVDLRKGRLQAGRQETVRELREL